MRIAIVDNLETERALEGFQVRALHYLVKPFSEEELSALLAEMLARLPRPEPVLPVKVSGSDVRLCYRNIISAEHFAHTFTHQNGTFSAKVMLCG